MADGAWCRQPRGARRKEEEERRKQEAERFCIDWARPSYSINFQMAGPGTLGGWMGRPSCG